MTDQTRSADEAGRDGPGSSPVAASVKPATNLRTFAALAACAVLIAGLASLAISRVRLQRTADSVQKRDEAQVATAAQNGLQPLKVPASPAGSPPAIGGLAPLGGAPASAPSADRGKVGPTTDDSAADLDEILAARSAALGTSGRAAVTMAAAPKAALAASDPFEGPALLAPTPAPSIGGATGANADLESGMAQARARLDETRSRLDRLISSAAQGGASGGGQTQDEGESAADAVKATSLARIQASRLIAPSLTLPRGTTFTCTLMNRIVSEQSGPASCVVARNVYGHDGTVLLIERGSHLDGRYNALSRAGQTRIAVIWERLRMPNGVVVDLGSPGTAALGEAGVDGFVDNHWPERIGASLMLSLINDAVNIEIAREQASGNGSGTILLQGSGAQGSSLAGKVLDATINMPPTVVKNQGEVIAVNVARDVDFSSVYELHAAN